MKTLSDYVAQKPFEYCEKNRRVTDLLLKKAEVVLEVSFGKQLREYLLSYGYLSMEYREFTGMTKNQGLESDLVKQSQFLHTYHPASKGWVVIEDLDDGVYALVNEKDEVQKFDAGSGAFFGDTQMLFDYIVSRFDSVQ